MEDPLTGPQFGILHRLRALPIVLGVVVLVACGSAGAGTAGSRAALSVRHGFVRGIGFHAGEEVRISFTGTTPRVQRRVRSSAQGAFATPLPAVDPCLGVLIVARGSEGDSARLKLPQRGCPPAARP